MENYKINETLLYVDKLCVGYDNKLILKDVSFVEHDITREGHNSTGQTIAFIGRSGRGKSTLFKALTGVIKPTSGQILINDLKSPDRNGAKVLKEGDIGFVDQKYTLFRHKTVTQICQYALRKINLSKTDKLDMINKYLTEWGLIEHKDKYPNELSGGQRQRTAIIEQILSSKHYMILDEPTSGLDIHAIETVKKSFKRILDADEYNTIRFSTHHIEFAVEMADSIYIIGFPEGDSVSTVIKHFDLKAMGLAWTDFGANHLELVKEIKDLIVKS